MRVALVHHLTRLVPSSEFGEGSVIATKGTNAKCRLANDATRQIPVIAPTAHAMAGDREKAIEVDWEDYHTKPIKLSRLLGKVAALIVPKAGLSRQRWR